MVKGLTRKGQLTRQALLDAARHVFSKKGYANTEIEDITCYAGKSRATFYNYIGGKPELLLALIADFREDRLKLPIVDGEQMFRERRRVLRLVWELYRTHAATLDAITQASALDPIFANEHRELTRRGIENCRLLLQYVQTIGYCLQFNPDITGLMLATMINANIRKMFSIWSGPVLNEQDDAIAFETLLKMIDAVIFSPSQTEFHE